MVNLLSQGWYIKGLQLIEPTIEAHQSLTRRMIDFLHKYKRIKRDPKHADRLVYAQPGEIDKEFESEKLRVKLQLVAGDELEHLSITQGYQFVTHKWKVSNAIVQALIREKWAKPKDGKVVATTPEAEAELEQQRESVQKSNKEKRLQRWRGKIIEVLDIRGGLGYDVNAFNAILEEIFKESNGLSRLEDEPTWRDDHEK